MGLTYNNVLPPSGAAENFIVKEMFDDVVAYFATVDDLYLKLTGGAVTGAVTITTVTATPLALSSNQSQTLLTIDNTATDGDPVLQWKLGGTAIFTAGVDDSASDALVISRGSVVGTNNDVVISQSTGAVAIRGSSTNDAAIAGNYGEQIVARQTSSTNFPSTGTYGDVASIALTPGDWDISAVVYASASGATTTQWDIGISTSSGNAFADAVTGDNQVNTIGPTATADQSLTIPSFRVSVAANTTYYLKVRGTFSVSTPKYLGRISARRTR